MNKCDKCFSFAINDDPAQRLCDKCWRDKRIAELERQLAISKDIQHSEKEILIKEIEEHTNTKQQLAECRRALKTYFDTSIKAVIAAAEKEKP